MPGRSALRHRGGGTPEQNITVAGAGNGAGAAAEHRGSDTAELDKIFNEFASVRQLKNKDIITPRMSLHISKSDESGTFCPSFSRFFTHATWDEYNGVKPLTRWMRDVASWRHSTVLRAVLPCCIATMLWTLVVSLARMHILPEMTFSPLPIQLQGTAIGLLLVFRTNNSYKRLADARALWGKLITITREMSQGAAIYLKKNSVAEDGSTELARRIHAKTFAIIRYLGVFGWVLKARCRGGESAADVLNVLFEQKEAEYIANHRSPPAALIGRIRQALMDVYADGSLPFHLHAKLEQDLKELDQVIGSVDRLFSSPIPPTMSRHVVRTMVLWIAALPILLHGTMPTFAIAISCGVMTYIYVGIEELGVQVEQPFDILPLWQISHLVARSAEEGLASNVLEVDLPAYAVSVSDLNK